jgi:hypothetical protein
LSRVGGSQCEAIDDVESKPTAWYRQAGYFIKKIGMFSLWI